MQSRSHDAPEAAAIILTENEAIVGVAVVVGGLLLIICVVVICAVVTVVRFRQYSRRERTEAAMIPMHPVAFSNSYNNDALDDAGDHENPANNIQTSDNNNASSDFQQPSVPVAGGVDGVGNG